MPIKGKTKIELKNAQGEIVQTVEDENMLTNGLQKALSEYWYNLAGYDFVIANNLPIATEAYGGILLWDNTITEDVNITFPPAGVESLGNAGSPTTDTNPFRGDYNQEESGYITNGYRHVFDFATDKGNGVIKSVSLCNKKTGDSGFKVYRNKLYLVDYATSNISISSCTRDFEDNCNLIDIFEQDGVTYAMFYTDSNNQYIGGEAKYVLYKFNSENEVNMLLDATSSIGLMEYFETQTPIRELLINSSAGIVKPTVTTCFRDETYFYLNYSTSTKKAMRIKKDLTSYEYVTFPYLPSIKPLGISDNMIFLSNATNTPNFDVYDMTTQTKVYSCEFAFDNILLTNTIASSKSLVKKISENQYAFFNNSYGIFIIDTLKEKVFIAKHGGGGTHEFSAIDYLLSEFDQKAYPYRHPLMSINNLPEAVTKTAELTMKITYDLLQV